MVVPLAGIWDIELQLYRPILQWLTRACNSRVLPVVWLTPSPSELALAHAGSVQHVLTMLTERFWCVPNSQSLLKERAASRL